MSGRGRGRGRHRCSWRLLIIAFRLVSAEAMVILRVSDMRPSGHRRRERRDLVEAI